MTVLLDEVIQELSAHLYFCSGIGIHRRFFLYTLFFVLFLRDLFPRAFSLHYQQNTVDKSHCADVRLPLLALFRAEWRDTNFSVSIKIRYYYKLQSSYSLNIRVIVSCIQI